MTVLELDSESPLIIQTQYFSFPMHRLDFSWYNSFSRQPGFQQAGLFCSWSAYNHWPLLTCPPSLSPYLHSCFLCVLFLNSKIWAWSQYNGGIIFSHSDNIFPLIIFWISGPYIVYFTFNILLVTFFFPFMFSLFHEEIKTNFPILKHYSSHLLVWGL